jgi:hypothetical protein
MQKNSNDEVCTIALSFENPHLANTLIFGLIDLNLKRKCIDFVLQMYIHILLIVITYCMFAKYW